MIMERSAPPQVDKLLQRIKLQASGEAEAPPITLPDWLDEEDLEGGDDDEDDSVEASAGGMTEHLGLRWIRMPGSVCTAELGLGDGVARLGELCPGAPCSLRSERQHASSRKLLLHIE